MDLVPTKAYIFFSLFFLLGGLMAISVVIHRVQNGQDYDEVLGTLIVGPCFVTVGLCLLFGRKKISLQNLNGKWLLIRTGSFSTRKLNLNPTEDIYAIQILEKTVSDDGAFLCYELNLVYKDGSRVNVFNQSGYESMVRDASIIEESVKIPVWISVKEHKYLSLWGINSDT